MSLFVNITAMVVNSYTVLYMCVEFIICQFDTSDVPPVEASGGQDQYELRSS